MAIQASFYRTLAAYHRAGIGWPEAVSTAAGMRGGMASVSDRVRSGEPLSDALREHADPVECALLRAGEASGSLEDTLERLALDKEEEARESKERWAGLAYPIVLAHLGAVLLPLPDLMQGNPGKALFWSALILVPLWVWIFAVRRIQKAQRRHTERPLPTWGPFRNAADEGDARCFRVLAACFDAGVPLTEALRLARETSPGSRAGQDLARAQVLAQGGSGLGPAWQAVAPEFAERLQNAEHVGELDQEARRIAGELALDVRLRRKRSQAIVPVAVLLVIGGIIAWRVLSFYGGLYSSLGR